MEPNDQNRVALSDQFLDRVLAVLGRIADIVGLGRDHRRETPLERLHDLARVVHAERGLRNGGHPLRVGNLGHLGLLYAADQQHAAGRDAERALDLLVARVADQDHAAVLARIALDLEMHLGDQRAGGVDHAQTPVVRALPFAGRDAVRAEDHALALGHFGEVFDENRAFLDQRFEHEAVVHDLMAHVERTAIGAERATHGLDRAVDAGAKAARLGQDYFFDVMFTQRHQGS